MSIKDKIIIKSVYFPVIGLFLALFLALGNKYNNKILNERHANLWMMLSHLITAEIIVIYLLTLKL